MLWQEICRRVSVKFWANLEHIINYAEVQRISIYVVSYMIVRFPYQVMFPMVKKGKSFWLWEKTVVLPTSSKYVANTKSVSDWLKLIEKGCSYWSFFR
jgi:hypothetical protein